jgi:hypothetical protein
LRCPPRRRRDPVSHASITGPICCPSARLLSPDGLVGSRASALATIAVAARSRPRLSHVQSGCQSLALAPDDAVRESRLAGHPPEWTDRTSSEPRSYNRLQRAARFRIAPDVVHDQARVLESADWAIQSYVLKGPLSGRYPAWRSRLRARLYTPLRPAGFCSSGIYGARQVGPDRMQAW